MLQKNKKIRAPKGYYFKVFKADKYRDVRVVLFTTIDHRQIGSVNLEKIPRGNFYATHSNLHFEHRNKKLGALMYAKAIQWCHDNGFNARSSGSSSSDAQRVWKSKTLNARFKIKVRNRTDYYGSTYTTWYVYKLES
jgi:GNAT superfamily N-acetyltransferase